MMTKAPPLSRLAAKKLASFVVAFAVLAGYYTTAPAEDELGRLFFTPERRQALDRQRQLNIQEKQEIPEDPMLTINGAVTRSSGKRTVWINGIPQNENETHSGVTVTTSRKEPGKVLIQASDALAGQAKVGDTLNRNTGESVGLLGDERIEIKKNY